MSIPGFRGVPAASSVLSALRHRKHPEAAGSEDLSFLGFGLYRVRGFGFGYVGFRVLGFGFGLYRVKGFGFGYVGFKKKNTVPNPLKAWLQVSSSRVAATRREEETCLLGHPHDVHAVFCHAVACRLRSMYCTVYIILSRP